MNTPQPRNTETSRQECTLETSTHPSASLHRRSQDRKPQQVMPRVWGTANGSHLTLTPLSQAIALNLFPIHLPPQWAGMRLRPAVRQTPLNPKRHLPPRKVQERKVQVRKERRRSPDLQVPQWLHVLRQGAELEASEVWAVQSQRIRVLQMATLPKPES
jgi:hypothetical protein